MTVRSVPGRLQDKITVVTGSTRGLGFAIAQEFQREGGKVAIVGRDQGAVNTAVQRLGGRSDRLIGSLADVTSASDIHSLLDELEMRWGRVDVLVNNAGGALGTPHQLSEVREADWDLVVDVNLKGAFLCCQAVIPRMASAAGGAIVNMSALAGHWHASLAGVQYVAAKAGVEGLTRQLAYEWGHANIRVNAVAPSVTLSGDRVRSLWEAKSETEVKRTIDSIPLRRLGTPKEVASAVVFLASDDASFVTGITLDVNGGRFLR